MTSDVFFLSIEDYKKNNKRLSDLFNKAGFDSCINRNDFSAIKIHFGEDKLNTFIPPDMVKPIIESLKRCEARPFLTDTCVLYKAMRDNAVGHLLVAYKHGYSIDNLGIPVIIGDGLLGNQDDEIEIRGEIFNTVELSSIVFETNSMIVISHVTGHMGTGMGAAIKNIGMGLASRKGKLRQHSGMNPTIKQKKCTGCGVCIGWCPVDAISLKDQKAFIDPKKCIGCGECLAVCNFNAVGFRWHFEGVELQKRMAEHALGVVKVNSGKIGFINFLINITKDCDCMTFTQEPIVEDIGFLASKDPVAVDNATLDLISKRAGKNIGELSYPEIDEKAQIRHGEKIGLGSSDYRLIEI